MKSRGALKKCCHTVTLSQDGALAYGINGLTLYKAMTCVGFGRGSSRTIMLDSVTNSTVFTLSEGLESPDLGDFPSGESPVFGDLHQVHFGCFVGEIEGFDGRRASPQPSPVERGHSHPDGASVARTIRMLSELALECYRLRRRRRLTPISAHSFSPPIRMAT